MRTIMPGLAEFELDLIREHVKSWFAAASRVRGVALWSAGGPAQSACPTHYKTSHCCPAKPPVRLAETLGSQGFSSIFRMVSI
jgi:hypothetical protein